MRDIIHDCKEDKDRFFKLEAIIFDSDYNGGYSGWFMQINGGEYEVKVTYCPFCGAKLNE